MIVNQNSPHTRPGVTPFERDRVAAIFASSAVNNLAASLLTEAQRNLEFGGTRRLITHAINAAVSGVMDGRSKPLAELAPADVERALESAIVECEIEREAERGRQEAHRQAQQAVDAEWAELQVAVTERHNAVAAELARVVELLLGKAVDMTDQRQALEKHARELAASVARFQAFADDRRANYWQVYDQDSLLDCLLEATAEKLGIPAPEAPIEVPA